MGMPLRLALAVGLVIATTLACENNPAKDAPVTAKNDPKLLQPHASIGSADQSLVSDFGLRVQSYIALQQQLAGTLKKLPSKPTPVEIDAQQRALATLIAKARSDAKQGDIFVPDMQKFIRGLVRQVISGPDGARIKSSFMDENPMGVKLAVNLRYPDTIPLSTMPPDILGALPKLPEDLEYRFVGNRLIILDNKSHLIVDFVENTFDI